jgi:two-component system nitrate/nitrite response regulator NarL
MENELNCEVIAEAYTGVEFLELDCHSSADLILMDIEMPEMDGILAVKKILWKYRSLKLIAITMYQDHVYLKNLVEAGFRGCVFKQQLFTDLKDAISVVMKDQLYFPENIKLEYGGLKNGQSE